jgi:SAM-dependent methyltransferase
MDAPLRASDLAGDWRGLELDASQAPRYARIAALMQRHGADRHVLDVGCGQALLRQWLPRECRYLGVEPSALAVQQARERCASDGRAQIELASAECFDAGARRFDAVVFNEMLYYAADPCALLRRYAAMLGDRGVIVGSIYMKPGGASLRGWARHLLDRRRPLSNAHCWQMVCGLISRARWQVLDEERVSLPGTSLHWQVWAVRPVLR